MDLKYTKIDSRDPKKSIDVRFIALRCIVFELSAFENLAEFPAESGCKANDLTRYKVRYRLSHVTSVITFYLIFDRSGTDKATSQASSNDE